MKIVRASILFSFGVHAALVGAGWCLWTGSQDERDAFSMLISIRDEPGGVAEALPELIEPPRPQDPVETPALPPEEAVKPMDDSLANPERAHVERSPFELRLNARLATPLRVALRPKPPGVEKKVEVKARPAEPLHAPSLKRSGNKPPPYPLAAQRRGLEGRVLLAVFVGADGSVRKVRVQKSSGHRLLDAAAAKAARAWSFRPARRNGRHVPAWIHLPIDFRLCLTR